LAKSTTNQSKTLFQVHLLAWAKDVGLTLLRELTTPNLVKFRATWGDGPNTTRRKHERLIGFFEFCIGKDWLDKNPALKMKKAEEKPVVMRLCAPSASAISSPSPIARSSSIISCSEKGRLRLARCAPPGSTVLMGSPIISFRILTSLLSLPPISRLCAPTLASVAGTSCASLAPATTLSNTT